jgi:hypothetical protein
MIFYFNLLVQEFIINKFLNEYYYKSIKIINICSFNLTDNTFMLLINNNYLLYSELKFIKSISMNLIYRFWSKKIESTRTYNL